MTSVNLHVVGAMREEFMAMQLHRNSWKEAPLYNVLFEKKNF